MLDGSDDRYREKGIRFVLGSAADGERVWELTTEEFIPDEPGLR